MIPKTEEQMLLDTMINLGAVSKWLLSGLRLKGSSLSSDQLDEMINGLKENGWLSVEGSTAERIFVPEDKRDKINDFIGTLLAQRGVSSAALMQEIEDDYIGVVKTLAFLRADSDDRFEIGFSDYSSDRQALQLCEKLANKGYLFYVASSSKKHYYQTFYPRRIPFDVREILQQFVVDRLNLEGLDLSSDWRLLIMLVFSENTTDITLDDLGLCLPNYTKDEIAEATSKLETRGIVARQTNRFKIPGGIKDLVESYFIINKYQEFKASLIHELRQRVSERPSSLYMLGVIKRILLEAGLSGSKKPFITIKRYDIHGITEQDLAESSKLGVLFLTSSTVMIATEALSELEELLRSAIREETFANVPAG
jgi:hypothetical protein